MFFLIKEKEDFKENRKEGGAGKDVDMTTVSYGAVPD